jgi:flagellin-specific chaperone FliS
MNPYQKYKQISSRSWTRVDMLLVVYDQVVTALNDGVRLLREDRTTELPAVRLRAMRTLLAIADGLDLNQGDVPNQVLRLVEYSLEQIKSQSADAWLSAAEVINKLREGFQEIQEQARKDEYEGRIPALDVVGQVSSR